MSCPTPVLPDVTTLSHGDGVWYGERGRRATGAPGVVAEEHGDGRVGARRDAGCASSCCMKGVAASARRVRPEPRRRTAGGGAPLGVVTAARACYGRFGYETFHRRGGGGGGEPASPTPPPPWRGNFRKQIWRVRLCHAVQARGLVTGSASSVGLASWSVIGGLCCAVCCRPVLRGGISNTGHGARLALALRGLREGLRHG